MANANVVTAEIMGSLKIPPAWSPELDNQYPFRHWVADITMWAAASSREIHAEAQAPAVVLRLGGHARLIARSMDARQLQEGTWWDAGDGNGPQWISGLTLLLQTLAGAFAPLSDEMSFKFVADLLAFQRRSGETIDRTVARFEVTRRLAATEGQFAMGNPGYAWMLLSALRATAQQWRDILADFRGELLQTDQQYLAMLRTIRRMGHLLENHPLSIANQAGRTMGGRGQSGKGAHVTFFGENTPADAQQDFPNDDHYHNDHDHDQLPSF